MSCDHDNQSDVRELSSDKTHKIEENLGNLPASFCIIYNNDYKYNSGQRFFFLFLHILNEIL